MQHLLVTHQIIIKLTFNQLLGISKISTDHEHNNFQNHEYGTNNLRKILWQIQN